MSDMTIKGSQLNAESRRSVMRTLANARASELAETLNAHWPGLVARDLKPIEHGLVMLRGRIGGDGASFNIGEATITRAVVELSTGERGYSHVLGRDATHARCAAVFDALAQQPSEVERLQKLVLLPIEQRLSRERAQQRIDTDRTRVDFFTLVRGDG